MIIGWPTQVIVQVKYLRIQSTSTHPVEVECVAHAKKGLISNVI